MTDHTIELLSPAANQAYGRAAILAGADAVYIGGPGFGARRAAGNPVEEIASLVRFAHGFGARVYTTMNTILLQDELQSARDQACRLWEAGVDALIVQDMAFLEMDLPPVALHASTQSFNATPERVKLLADSGFSRVILERGVSLDTIRQIRQATDVELEAFVHGAICVSYSGQCYFGHALCGRGGNRGACAQACRGYYNLENGRGDRLLSGANLLSPKDMNLSDDLGELIAAGICSLKIEGRLKELSYVVNNTAHYHHRLEELGVARTASGSVSIGFEPNPVKSFSRGFTTYNLHGAERGWASGSSTRSLGERIGMVVSLSDRYAVVTGAAGVLAPGDGVCFVDASGQTRGTNVNRADAEKIYFNSMDNMTKGLTIYRNHDHNFSPDERSVCRTVGVYLKMRWDEALRPVLSVSDEDGFSAELRAPKGYDAARNTTLALTNLAQALGKTGGTIFEAMSVDVQPDASGRVPFVPNAEINGLRRELLDRLFEARLSGYARPMRSEATVDRAEHPSVLDFRANISNTLSRQFYERMGFTVAELAAETQPDGFLVGRAVMRTPFCIRRELGACRKGRKFEGVAMLPDIAIEPAERLFIENNGQRFELVFDCAVCEMEVVKI